MTMNLIPLGDRVVIKPVEEEGERTVGGIIIPATASKEKPQTGKVIAIGTDEEVTEALNVGDMVIYAKYGGTEISLDNEDFIILEFGDIKAKVID
jgi:chaperonin GroES